MVLQGIHSKLRTDDEPVVRRIALQLGWLQDQRIGKTGCGHGSMGHLKGRYPLAAQVRTCLHANAGEFRAQLDADRAKALSRSSKESKAIKKHKKKHKSKDKGTMGGLVPATNCFVLYLHVEAYG